jgi:hypothetical protein
MNEKEKMECFEFVSPDQKSVIFKNDSELESDRDELDRDDDIETNPREEIWGCYKLKQKM